jgi:DNA-binding response OmpR family regulator
MFNSRESKQAAGKTVLVVDDEPNIVRTVSDRLKMNGYRVITATDGQEAIERALEEKPDLILLDVLMPRLDGHAALERLRQMEETRSTPVIMLTALDQTQHVARASSMGIADYVVKPFDLLVLLQKVKSALSNGKER